MENIKKLCYWEADCILFTNFLYMFRGIKSWIFIGIWFGIWRDNSWKSYTNGLTHPFVSLLLCCSFGIQSSYWFSNWIQKWNVFSTPSNRKCCLSQRPKIQLCKIKCKHFNFVRLNGFRCVREGAQENGSKM